ncbi:hypothetical protein [Pelagicoccus sp. SDUM812002]|uniref:hypothetical protein n=1 Tax=Pelagicoccus sp. SDUM812002 TaxID=3041266 RepID=UPI00280E897F|nr:hypothetical protein [Pelagicoccus sp. SDUM812002]MDQ8186268.1 hypothetical protein [Pelagicoccus sp. SDUM812002]
MKTYSYTAYGLAIESEIEFRELSHGSSEKTDVYIQEAKVPLPSNGQWGEGTDFHAEEGKLLLVVDGVARYLAQGGIEITFERLNDASYDDVRLFLLGSVLGAILMQRRRLVLHGSVVSSGGKAVAFLGDSGVGKSTLAASLVKAGMALLSDDICSISGIEVDSGFPQSKLWLDSLDWMGLSENEFRRVRPQFEKRAIPIDLKDFHSSSCPLERIFVLNKTAGRSLVVRDLSGTRKFLGLSEKSYRLQFVEGMGLSRLHFQQIAELAKTVRVTEVIRPSDGMPINRLVSAILENLEVE